MLDAWFPTGQLGLGRTRPPEAGSTADVLGPAAGRRSGRGRCPACRTVGGRVGIGSLADPTKDTADVWLRLHLLSHRLVRPHDANLDGMFGLLTNVAWTSAGPCPPDRVDELRVIERAAGRVLSVYGVDKFPRMTDYVVPSGVRIADADRVRLGAHLAAGTTVMHEGFVNFNAGTLGTSMVEGRIVAGVVVGDGSDIGGGASIMGTLSGGGKEVVRIGERCLLGANAGVGISPRRRLRRRGRLLHHRRLEDHPAGRPGGQGPRAVRRAQPAVPGATRSPARWRPGPAGPGHRAQRRPARQRLTRRDVKEGHLLNVFCGRRAPC